MSIRFFAAAVVTIISLGSASPAYAWFGDGWLEMLSGPGPFRGRSVDLRLVCLSKRPANPGTLINPDDAIGWKLTFPKDTNAGVWFSPLGCHFLDRDQSRLEFGFEYSSMGSESGDNPLDYTHRPTLVNPDKSVDLSSFTITADVRVNRILDLGVTVGQATFSSPGGLFADLTKTVFQPVRVTVRPFSALTDRNRLAEMVSVRVDATKFNGGFRAEEFGARPGTFEVPGELVWGWRVLVDAGTLFWLR
jgi:hypothetical protein